MTYRLDEVALREAKALAARQPRCDLVIPWLPALPSPPVATDLLAVYRQGETYSATVGELVVTPPPPPPTYDQLVLATPGLTHYWPLNDAAGSGTVADKVGGVALAVHGNVQLGAPPVCTDGETTVRFLGTPVGDGLPSGEVADYITLPSSVFPSSGPFSVEFIAADGWVTGQVTGVGIMVCNGGLPSDPGFDMYSSGGATPEYTISGPSGGDYSAIYIGYARTAHFVLVYDNLGTSTSVRTYINGWWITSNSATTYGNMFGTAGGFIGKRVDNSDGYVGRIGKLAIYNVALTNAQIYTHFNQGGVNQ